MEFILILIGALAVLISVLIFVLKKQMKKKKLLNYFKEEYLNILRLDALNRAIVSPGDLLSAPSGPRKILVKLEEKSDLTQKERLIDMEHSWIIGRRPGENVICIKGDKTVSSVHAMLRADKGRLFLIDMGGRNRILYKPVRRGACYLQPRAVQHLTTGDSFNIGYTRFTVTVFDSSVGII